MGESSPPEPALRLLAVFSRHDAALAWARAKAEQAWGPVALASPVFAFRETDYYQATMGDEIKKMFLAFAEPFDQGDVVESKLQTGDWEREYAACGFHAEERPVNLDPGYLTNAKLVLASTKDHAHRIYQSRGIYAEVTLFYRDRQWQHHPWTFPDYRRADYQEFFTHARDFLRARQKQERR
ncbi:MAG TPA: DUF4416 family protein [Pirellulales bacterium]|jgi:hypothetical protein